MKRKLTTSVALCSYNGDKYIAEQLKSIINQTVKPNQIVISDDGSSDKTVEICENLLSKSGIEYIININKPTLGITENFDKCFMLCTGDIIFPSDQDNVWDVSYIESFLDYFEENPNDVLVFCNGWVTDKNLKKQKITYTDEQMEIKDKQVFLRNALDKVFAPHGHTIAVKCDFVKKCIPSGFYYDGWLTMCAAAEMSVGTINKKIILFRRHDESASGAEGGGKKNSKIERIKRRSFDEFFIWPRHQNEAYERFLSLYEKKIDKSICSEVREHAKFERNINELRYLPLIKREYRLFLLFFRSEYKKFRGNKNTFLLDAFYLLRYRKENNM